MALLQLSDIQQGSLTNRLDVVLKKNLAFWLAMLFSSSLGFVIIFPAAAMSDCLGQNRVHWQMQSRQFSYSFIHSCFVQVLFPLTCCVCQKNYISLQLLRKWEFSVHLLHNHNNDDLINRMQDALDHCTLLICMSLSTSSDRNAEKWRHRCRAVFQESVGGTNQGATAKKERKKRIKRKKKKREIVEEKRTGGTSSNRRFFLITSRKRREDEGNSVSPVTRHWTDIIKSFSRSLSLLFRSMLREV